LIRGQPAPKERNPIQAKPESWLRPLPQGLYCAPGGFFIDPVAPVERAIVTHGHSDHARAGNGAVLATPATLAIMRLRQAAPAIEEKLPYGETRRIGDVDVTLHPAGHVLGSAQIRLEHGGFRVVLSGDYKRRADPTCAPFEPIPCDLFVTEATFALPVFRHPPDIHEIGKLLDSLALYPDRAHLVGVYALGKCQRVIMLLRRAGYDRPIFIHGALAALCDLYRDFGLELGPLAAATEAKRDALKGEIVLAPPGAIADRWSRRLPDPVVSLASGWMLVRQRARQRGVELPLVISDHADWDELIQTIADVQAPEIWVTHGREEALIHYAGTRGIRARALDLVGFEEEEE
jgi:putative mRNA 3-end processing factor